MSSHATFTRRTLLGAAGAAGAGLSFGGFGPSAVAAGRPAPVKQRPTLYTEAMRQSARANIANGYSWAVDALDAAKAKADRLVDRTDEWLWSSITSQGLGRSSSVHPQNLTPDRTEIPLRGWICDPDTQPWKIQDPVSGRVLPTNDFEAFYHSGLNSMGEFDRALADESLLVNTLYPELGPDWGVDDGWGWVDDEGERFMPVAYYNHWYVWGYNNYTVDGIAVVSSGLQGLRDAFLYTGDLKYAHAGVILLDRIADIYPAMRTEDYPREDGFTASDGLTGHGKAVGCIWETFVSKYLISAYDAFFPTINESDDAEVLDFLSAKASQHGLPAKNTLADIRSNIEDNILRQIEPEVRNANIRGNFGMHQSAIGMAAVVLDHPAESQPWMDFVFQRGGLVNDSDGWRVTGGNVGATLVEDVDRDGWGYESPSYNLGWIDQLQDLADALANYDGFSDLSDLYRHPKFQAMMLARHNLTVQNAFTAAIGDMYNAVALPVVQGSALQHANAFAHYHDSALPKRHELAQAAYLKNGNSAAGLNAGMFVDAGALEDQISQVIADHGPLTLQSHMLPGYGASLLRNGNSGPAALLYSGCTQSHGHRDALFVNMWHYGLDLASALGYPEYADSRPRTTEWTRNTIGANTVMVDAAPQEAQQLNTSLPQLWVDTPQVKLIDTDATSVYADRCSRYRRALVQVMVSDDDAYYLDLFRVDGGDQHLYSFHAIASEASVSGVTLTAQETGTYAGPDVPVPPETTTGGDRTASGFNYLPNVSRGVPADAFSVDWPVLDPHQVLDSPQEIHLRLTMLHPVDEVALADGLTARNKEGNPNPLRYLLAKREGSNLTSRFTSIIQPYHTSPFIVSAEQVPVVAAEGDAFDAGDVTAVKVELIDGRVDYLVSSLRPDIQFRIDDAFLFTGEFGMFRTRGRAADLVVTAGATELTPLVTAGRGVVRTIASGPAAVVGEVVDFTHDLTSNSTITLAVDDAVADAQSLAGTYVYIANDGERNGAYRIIDAQSAASSTLTLEVEGTVVRSYAPGDEDFSYNIEVGQSARIPLTRVWSRS